jgi:hypothetical protein
MLSTREVGNAVTFLASDEASGITGAVCTSMAGPRRRFDETRGRETYEFGPARSASGTLCFRPEIVGLVGQVELHLYTGMR